MISGHLTKLQSSAEGSILELSVTTDTDSVVEPIAELVTLRESSVELSPSSEEGPSDASTDSDSASVELDSCPDGVEDPDSGSVSGWSVEIPSLSSFEVPSSSGESDTGGLTVDTSLNSDEEIVLDPVVDSEVDPS